MQLASVASVVGQAARDGDAVACALLAEAGAFLGTAAVNVIRELTLQTRSSYRDNIRWSVQGGQPGGAANDDTHPCGLPDQPV